jgi:hypothetical protein
MVVENDLEIITYKAPVRIKRDVKVTGLGIFLEVFGKDLRVERYGFLGGIHEIIDPFRSVYSKRYGVAGIHSGKPCPLNGFDKLLQEIAVFYALPAGSHPRDDNSDSKRDYQQDHHHLDEGKPLRTTFETKALKITVLEITVFEMLRI